VTTWTAAGSLTSQTGDKLALRIRICLGVESAFVCDDFAMGCTDTSGVPTLA
jgi:hypothetical protein